MSGIVALLVACGGGSVTTPGAATGEKTTFLPPVQQHSSEPEGTSTLNATQQRAEPLLEPVQEAIDSIDAPPDLRQLQTQLDSEDTATRLKALAHSTKLPPETALQLLVSRLDDPDPVVRQSALMRLAKLNNPTARNLIEQALSDHDDNVVELALSLRNGWREVDP